ncbi:MAG: hypothetical protein AB8E15_05610 [Bdellovibrionales bacterium]
MKKSDFHWLVFLLLAPFLISCSTYAWKMEKPLRFMSEGKPELAADFLEPLAFTASDDQLVYLLDYAVAQQAAGNFEKSNLAFQLADEISEVKDYISISKQTASVFLSESLVPYKGDDYEKILINALSSINYASMGNTESALVEVRRLNEKLNLYRVEAGIDYSENPFAYYFSAILWESEGQLDSALIDYKKAFKLRPDFPGIREDIARIGFLANSLSDFEEHKSSVSLLQQKLKKWRAGYTELVIVFQNGFGPRKRPDPAWPRIAKIFPWYNVPRYLQATDASGGFPIRSFEVFNVEKAVINAWNRQYSALVAKRIAARIVKREAVRRLRKEDSNAALFAAIIMDVSDQADLRGWSSLPQTIQVLRLPLVPGENQIKLSIQGTDGFSKPDEIVVFAEPGKKYFRNYRSF